MNKIKWELRITSNDGNVDLSDEEILEDICNQIMKGYTQGFLDKESKVMKGNSELQIILKCACNYYNVPIEKVKSKSRKRDYVFPRQVYYAISRKLYHDKISLQQIADEVYRDHATVLHGIKEVNKAGETDHELWYDYLNILDEAMDQLIEHNYLGQL